MSKLDFTEITEHVALDPIDEAWASYCAILRPMLSEAHDVVWTYELARVVYNNGYDNGYKQAEKAKFESMAITFFYNYGYDTGIDVATYEEYDKYISAN